ncbi:MAG: radical SAM protein [Methanothrix sp.]|nr:radical SAM protein [Methanothrix sp.]MDD4447816.1 radical SAM protein [Methanothrix sp.]
MGLIVSPHIKIRPDGNRAILFSVNPTNSIYGNCFRFLNPAQAITLSLFNGKRDLTDVVEIVAYLFDLDTQTASHEVDALLSLPVNNEHTIGTFIIDVSDIDIKSMRLYDPKAFIPDKNQLIPDDPRCNIPCSMIVLPTMRCYTNCRYCYADRNGFRGKEFDVPLFKDLLRQAKNCGIETVNFSGGDIFCRSDAFELIEYTLSRGMYPNIPTKYPLSKDQIERLSEMGLSTIQISIDALDSNIIDDLVAVSPGYGNRILQTLNYLGEIGIKVRTNTVLTPYNIRDAINLAKYLTKQPYIIKSNFTCYGRSIYHHHENMFCPSEMIHIFKNDFDKIKNIFPAKIFFSGLVSDPYKGDEAERTTRFSKRSFCTASRRGFVVLPDGRVTICEELYFHDSFIIGDLNKQSLMEIWASPKAMELAHPSQALVPDGACRDCLDFRTCHEGLGRCFRECIKSYGIHRPHWPDPRCPKAPIGNRIA